MRCKGHLDCLVCLGDTGEGTLDGNDAITPLVEGISEWKFVTEENSSNREISGWFLPGF